MQPADRQLHHLLQCHAALRAAGAQGGPGRRARGGLSQAGFPVAWQHVNLYGRYEFGKINGGNGGFNLWTINGEPFEKSEPIPVQQGRRYRLAFVNKSDDLHPLHLHRHNFELTKVHGQATAGIFKDTVLIQGFSRVEVDFVADNPGLTLFHCHQNLHMDFGFMRLFEYV